MGPVFLFFQEYLSGREICSEKRLLTTLGRVAVRFFRQVFRSGSSCLLDVSVAVGAGFDFGLTHHGMTVILQPSRTEERGHFPDLHMTWPLIVNIKETSDCRRLLLPGLAVSQTVPYSLAYIEHYF
jgi:hypothetical protein